MSDFADVKLTEHFSLSELTVTSNQALQAANRILTPEQVDKLHTLAEHCEKIRELCGAAVRIHSGYRSAALNTSTVGASPTSQHPRCEAVDFDVPGQPLDLSFEILLQAAKDGKFKFGQLIIEMQDRGYKGADGKESIARWVHCSVVGTFDPARVGEVRKIEEGPDGHPHSILLCKLDFKEVP